MYIELMAIPAERTITEITHTEKQILGILSDIGMITGGELEFSIKFIPNDNISNFCAIQKYLACISKATRVIPLCNCM
jgi:hypothetical protein